MTKRVALHRLRNISRRRPTGSTEQEVTSGQIIEWPIKADPCLEDS